MRISLVLILVGLSTLVFSQYTGGIGDGYASSEIDFSTVIEKILDNKNVDIFMQDDGVNFLNNNPSEIQVIVNDVQGKFILKLEIESNEQKNVVLDKGIYIFSLISVSGIETRKIFIL